MHFIVQGDTEENQEEVAVTLQSIQEQLLELKMLVKRNLDNAQ
jgi:hypothetical protein